MYLNHLQESKKETKENMMILLKEDKKEEQHYKREEKNGELEHKNTMKILLLNKEELLKLKD
jgi:hypothetical protein